MKKTIVLIILLLSILLLSSCEVIDFVLNIEPPCKNENYYFDYEKLTYRMVKVQIAEWTSDDVIVLKEFTYEESLQIIYDLCQIKHMWYIPFYGGPPGPDGICIKVFYENDDWEFFSYYGTSTEICAPCSKDEYFNLLSKYLGYNIYE